MLSWWTLIVLLFSGCWHLRGTIFSSWFCLGGWRFSLRLLCLIAFGRRSICLTISFDSCFFVSSWGIGLGHFRLTFIFFLLIVLSLAINILRISGHLICLDLHGWLFFLHNILMLRLSHAIHVLVGAWILLLVVLLRNLVSIHVEHTVAHLTLDWGESARWSSHSQLFVVMLSLSELLLILSNGHVHELSLLTLLVLECLVVATSRHATPEHFNLLLILVLFLPHLVDSLDEVDVVFHEARVVLAVLLQVAGELLTVVADVSLMSFSLTCMLRIRINILSLAVGLLLDPGLVEANDAFLELLVVSDMLNNIKDVIAEPLLLKFLHV